MELCPSRESSDLCGDSHHRESVSHSTTTASFANPGPSRFSAGGLSWELKQRSRICKQSPL